MCAQDPTAVRKQLTMPSGERQYGVQVGNEVYSLIVTEEDWEKRKQDRERARKLTIETNRRRKALEDRKKLADERENRKRELELAKRRQRQIEATERYQRAHMGVRERKNQTIETMQNAPTLEAVLQQLRSGDALSRTSTGPDYASSTSSAEVGRRKFEAELEEKKSKVLEQHRRQTVQEFSVQLHGNGVAPSLQAPVPSGTNHISSEKSYQNILEEYPTEMVKQQNDDETNKESSFIYSHSNVDIMSGRAYSTYRPPSSSLSKRLYCDEEKEFKVSEQKQNDTKLAESLSRLFVGQAQNITKPVVHPSGGTTGLKIEEADDIVQDSLDVGNPMVISSTSNQNDQNLISSAQIYPRNFEYNADDYAHNKYSQAANSAAHDDLDSLHGSSSSGTSPRNASSGYSPVNYSDLKTTQTSSTLGSQLFRSREATLPNKSLPSSNGKEIEHEKNADDPKQTFSYHYHTATTSHLSSVSNGITRDEHPEITVDGSKAPLNYYVKAYRPWSASISSENRPQTAVHSRGLARPNSSYESRSIPTYQTPVQAFVKSTTEKENLEADKSQIYSTVTMDNGWGQQMSHYPSSIKTPHQEPIHSISDKSSVNKRPVLAKTKATPISAMYSFEGKPTNENNPKSVVLLARQAQNSGVLNSHIPNSLQKNDKVTDRQWKQYDVTSDLTSEKCVNREEEGSKVPVAAKPGKLKGILRRDSKYDSSSRMIGSPGPYPAYQSAGLARQQWVNGITIGSEGKLSATSLKDSIELTRQSQQKPTETELKSVRWHEVQYNDGTKSALGDVDSPAPKITNALPVTTQRIVARSPRPTVKLQPKVAKPPVAKSKPSSPPRGGKGAKAKGGKGRKLKPAKQPPSVIEPHPPEQKQKQLSMSTVVNYSINGDGNKESEGDKETDENVSLNAPSPENRKSILSPSKNRILFHTKGKVAWASSENEESVTMTTLKSTGQNQESSESVSSSPSPGANVVVSQGNQVTIHVVSPDMVPSSMKNRYLGTSKPSNMSPISLTRTPTDQEINWLWEKVRACLSYNSRSKSPSHNLLRKPSDTGRQNIYARKSAWNSTSIGMTPPQTTANIISIDGGMLGGIGQKGTPRSGRRLIRPSSAVMAPSTVQRQATEAYNSYMQRQGLLQRRQKQVRAQRTDRSASYPVPKPSNYVPASPVTGEVNGTMSDSMTTFLLAETLAEQNLSDDQIIQALNSLQIKTKEAQRTGRQMIPSCLSMEEQKLLASLERLNSRIQEIQTNTTSNPYVVHSLIPNQTAWTDYNPVSTDNVPVHYQHTRGRTVSADSRYRTSRIRY